MREEFNPEQFVRFSCCATFGAVNARGGLSRLLRNFIIPERSNMNKISATVLLAATLIASRALQATSLAMKSGGSKMTCVVAPLVLAPSKAMS
jgi:phage terminase large subunit-like protein